MFLREKKTVSIVISIFNEEENLIELYQQLAKYLNPTKNITCEFIFVNDGSTDKSLDILKTLMLKDNRIRIVNLVSNKGHEMAMTAGMDYARYDAVLFMDSDLQHPPALIPEMIEAWQKGYDLVMTERIDNRDENFLQKFRGKLFYKILNLLSDTHIPAQSPDFRLIDKKYVDILKTMRESHRMLRGLISWLRIPNSVTVKFSAPPRFKGKTKYNLKSLFVLALDSIISFSIKPLRLATYLGLFSSLISVLMGIFFIFDILTSADYAYSGYGTIISSVIFFGSIQLIFLGIIGEYLGRIHIEIKKRPLYIAEFYINDEIANQNG